MIRTAICFLALLFVVGSMIYLPTWVEHYKQALINEGARATLELQKMDGVEVRVQQPAKVQR